MANKLRLELDCTDDDCLYTRGPKEGSLNVDKLTRQIKKEAKRFKLVAELVNPNGPGGGCPVYAFTGTREALLAYLHAFHNPGLSGKALREEFDEYLENAEEA